MAMTTRPQIASRATRARGLGAPRGGRARSAAGRRSSFPSSPLTRAPANALSRYRRKVSNHPLAACDDPAGWRRGARMNLRALAAADPETPRRQSACGAVPIGDGVQIRAKDGSAFYCGLETCGNVWLCPVCSAKIHRRRADELRDALTTWETHGHAASLITITVPHDLGDPLSKLVAAERAAWKRITAGGSWQRLKKRLGIAGHVIALEFTWADANGWHPHYHVLLIHDQDLGAAAIAEMHAHIHARLAASCRTHGLRPPSQLHAVRIDPNVSATAAGAYLAKGGDWSPAEEMTRGDLKTGRACSRTPMQLLADYYQTGDIRDRELWREYRRVTRGLAAVRWSRGLRTRMLGPAAQHEQSDEELAAEEVDGTLVAVISLSAWSRIRLAGLEHAVLVAAERGGPAQVDSLLCATATGTGARP
jgi:Replication protein